MTAAAKSQEVFAAKEVAKLKGEIEDLEKRLAFKGSGGDGGNKWTNQRACYQREQKVVPAG